MRLLAKISPIGELLASDQGRATLLRSMVECSMLNTIAEASAEAAGRLAATSVATPRMTAELLLMFALDCDRAHLFAHPERELTSAESLRYENAVAERMRGVPVQYITGRQEFWGMDFIVTPAVLIPRPETEHVVEAALVCVGGAPSPAAPRIADVGTGSGCIAISLAKELPEAEIHATDISPEALKVARANADRHGLSKRIQFHHRDLLQGFDPQSFDLIISNPPYVGESEEVQEEVRNFEPRNAVFAGPTGIEVIARLIPQAAIALKPGGWLVIEISATFSAKVKQLLSGWKAVQISNDLQGIERVVASRKE